MTLLMQSKYAKCDREQKIDLRIRWPKSSEFDSNFDDLGHQIFESKTDMPSKSKMLSMTTSSSRTIDELDVDTAVYGRSFVSDARAAGGASLRGQTIVAWRGLGPETKRSALCTHLSLDTNEYS